MNRAGTMTLTDLPASVAGRSGPDMQQLHRCFPPRAVPVSWPGTEVHRDRLLSRLLAVPFTDGGLALQQRRRRGLAGARNGPASPQLAADQ